MKFNWLIWNLSIRQQKKVFLHSIQTSKEHRVMQGYETNVCGGALNHWAWSVKWTYPERLRCSEDVHLTPCACWVADCKVTKRSAQLPKTFIDCIYFLLGAFMFNFDSVICNLCVCYTFWLVGFSSSEKIKYSKASFSNFAFIPGSYA